MKIHTLLEEITLPITLDEAWSFFSSPQNLGTITPPSLNLNSTLGGEDKMYPGQIITYKVRPFPLTEFTWVTEITHVEEKKYFVDEQRFGPYKFWHHKHFFEETPQGGVNVKEFVHYALPFPPFGDLLMYRIIKKQVDYIFNYRKATLEKLFPSS